MSTPAEMIDYALKNTTAVTALISKRAWNSRAPKSATLPNITYYEETTPRRWRGMENEVFILNCRGKSRAQATELARVVVDLFHGTASTGIFGTLNGFDIGRAFVSDPSPIIAEPQSVYNVPVPVTIVYPSSTVS